MCFEICAFVHVQIFSGLFASLDAVIDVLTTGDDDTDWWKYDILLSEDKVDTETGTTIAEIRESTVKHVALMRLALRTIASLKVGSPNDSAAIEVRGNNEKNATAAAL